MTEHIHHVTIIGAGVIGSGWAARTALSGLKTTIYDPNPETYKITQNSIKNAHKAWQKLFPEFKYNNTIHYADTLAQAVENAHYIQENIPEIKDLKIKTYNEIEKYCNPNAIIASSTSGFKPSQLQKNMQYPQRFIVAHPFNPVYLLPLVEIVAGEQTTTQTVTQSQNFLQNIGMKTLIVKKEIDAHIADRLMEALWREALWLVHDGTATTQDIDDAIRYGCGIRWAQMGVFETFRIAGGKNGMKHFLKQFGPALKWPWSKLTETPELSKELIDKIVKQSDRQSAHHTINELENIRDNNLVDILNALKANRWGAGETIRQHQKIIREKINQTQKQSND